MLNIIYRDVRGLAIAHSTYFAVIKRINTKVVVKLFLTHPINTFKIQV